MKHYLIIQKIAPFTDYTAQEGIELAMALASFEQLVSLLFVGDGCWQLVSGNDPNDSNHGKSNNHGMDKMNSARNNKSNAENIAYRKNFPSNLKALHLSGVTKVYVNAADCGMRNINLQKLITTATAIDQQQQQQIINTADVVFTVG